MPAPYLWKWAADNQRLEKFRFELPIDFVGRSGDGVEGLAEEIASGSGQNHIQNLFVCQPMGAQSLEVMLVDLMRLRGDFLCKRHDRDFFRGQARVAEIL